MDSLLKNSVFSDLYLSEAGHRWKRNSAMGALPAEILDDANAAFEGCMAHREATGETDFSFRHDGVRYRGVVFESIDGPVFVLRRLSSRVLKWNELFLPNPLLNVLLYNDVVPQNRLMRGGLILILGKSDSGKSSTLNALIHEICLKAPWMVLTLEDPVETLFDSVNYAASGAHIIQREMSSDGFPEALRSAVRANADVIKVGEIRDREGARIALDAGRAGHLVLSTLHAGSVTEGVDRLISLVGEGGREAVAGALRCCVHQEFVKQAGVVNRLLKLNILPGSERTRNRIRANQTAMLNDDAAAITQQIIYSGRPMSGDGR